MKFSRIIKVTGLDRLNNSIYGNPNWAVYGEGEKGHHFNGSTVSNIPASYRLDSSVIGEFVKVFYHFTKGGKCKIDSIDF